MLIPLFLRFCGQSKHKTIFCGQKQLEIMGLWALNAGLCKDFCVCVCGRYNKLNLSQNKHPSPTEDEGVPGNVQRHFYTSLFFTVSMLWYVITGLFLDPF